MPVLKNITPRREKNQIGRKFNALTILGSSTLRTSGGVQKWRCVCDCGSGYYATLHRLQTGLKDCGHSRPSYINSRFGDGYIIDLIGQTFGRLTVVRATEQREHKCVKWECLCICGNTVIVKGSNLTNGHTTTCGCRTGRSPKPYKTVYPPEQQAIKLIIKTYSRGAKERNFAWELSPQDVERLIFANCMYCNAPPSRKLFTSKHVSTMVNGIDRAHNDDGYTVINAVTCCKRCNQAKGTMMLHEFREWIQRVYAFSAHPPIPYMCSNGCAKLGLT